MAVAVHVYYCARACVYVLVVVSSPSEGCGCCRRKEGGVAHEELMCVRDRGPESVLGGESVKNKIAL